MQKVFLVGCARSGTSWLHMILSSHDRIASVRETHLFDGYISKIYRTWDQEAEDPSNDGLRSLVSGKDLDAIAQFFADRVFQRIEATKPQALIALEKTPPHLFYHRLIRRLYPTARFINIVRDPRAVVASLMAVHREPWGGWAPGNVLDAARIWRTCARIGLKDLAGYGAHVHHLRYEDLHRDPERTMERLWQWLGLPPQPYDREKFSIDHLRTQGNADITPTWVPEGRANFFRRGTIDGWRDELSPDEIAVIEEVAGPYLSDLGYVAHQPA